MVIESAPLRCALPRGDGWNLKPFLAFCRRYGLKPYRRQGQCRTTVILRVVPSFANDILWPEFTQLADAQMT